MPNSKSDFHANIETIYNPNCHFHHHLRYFRGHHEAEYQLGHAIWHILGALSTGMLYLYYASETQES